MVLLLRDLVYHQLAHNDPKLTEVIVNVLNLQKITKALMEGKNEHVRKLEVSISFDNADAGISDTEMAHWKALCQVSETLPALEDLTVSFGDANPSRDHYLIMSLFLQHTQQIKSFHLQTDRGMIRSPALGVLAGSIAGHGSLERFRLENFESGPLDESLDSFIMALSSVPNLKGLHLDTDTFMRYYYDEDEDEEEEQLPVFNSIAVDADNLERLLRKPSLQSVAFGHFRFRDDQVLAIVNAVGSSSSQLKELSFSCCSFPFSLHALCRGVANSPYLTDLTLMDVLVQSCHGRENADMLEPLRFSRTLKRLSISLIVQGISFSWPRFSFLQANIGLESLVVGSYLYGVGLWGDSLASLFQALAENSHLVSLQLHGVSFDAGYLHSMAPLAVNKCLQVLCIQARNNHSAIEWPRFDFLVENSTIEHLRFACAMPPGNGYASLCQALMTNSSLKILQLVNCSGIRDAHSHSLGMMIAENTGVTELSLREHGMSAPACLENLVPSLCRNTTLRVLDIMSDVTLPPRWEVNKFVWQVLTATRIRDLSVDALEVNEYDVNSILTAAGKNYHLERFEFSACYKYAAYETFKGTMKAITKLNLAGRAYLGESKNKRGPWSKAAGVSVLSKVSDDLDCVFYHLRENPLLCESTSGSE